MLTSSDSLQPVTPASRIQHPLLPSTGTHTDGAYTHKYTQMKIIFNKNVSPNGDHVVLTQFILSASRCHLEKEGHIAFFFLLLFSLKHHGSNPLLTSSATTVLLCKFFALLCIFMLQGDCSCFIPKSLQTLVFLQPMIALTHSSQTKLGQPSNAVPFPVSFPWSHETQPTPFFLKSSLVYEQICSSPMLLVRLSAFVEESHGPRFSIHYPLPNQGSSRKQVPQKHVLN